MVHVISNPLRDYKDRKKKNLTLYLHIVLQLQPIVCVRMLSHVSLWPHWLQPTRLQCPWDFPGKNTGVGCHFLLQGIFPTQGSNSGLLYLLHWQVDSLPLTPPGKPCNQFSSAQSLSHVRLFVTPWIAACQASRSITNSRSSDYIMWNVRLDELQVGIKIARRNSNNFKYANDTTLMEESLSMRVKRRVKTLA